MANMAMRRVGAALILLSKARSSSASAAGRPNWARVYSTSLGVRGGATSDGIDGPGNAAPRQSKDPFAHLPAIEVRAHIYTPHTFGDMQTCNAVLRSTLTYFCSACTAAQQQRRSNAHSSSTSSSGLSLESYSKSRAW